MADAAHGTCAAGPSPMRTRKLPLPLALPLLAALAACGGRNIETVPGPVYMITVENPMSHPMDVWYDDGAETVELGRVEAGMTREFVVAGPEQASVEIIARDNDDTHTITRTLELTSGGNPRVVLRP